MLKDAASRLVHSIRLSVGGADVLFIIDDRFLNGSFNPTLLTHSHATHEIFFVKNGELDIRTSSRDFHLSEGEIILIPAEPEMQCAKQL